MADGLGDPGAHIVKGAWIYGVFCLLVVGTFVLSQHEGWVLFGTGLAAASGGGGGSGGRGGTYIGSHK